MSAFVDTSALYALMDESDARHAEASDALRRLAGTQLITHPLVVGEACALVGHRLPWAATERLVEGILPVLEVQPVSAELFEAALASYRRSGSARVSVVDQVSFAIMRSLGIRRAFAFDDDFRREGFALVA